MRINEAKQCIKELYLNTESVSALVGKRKGGAVKPLHTRNVQKNLE